MRYAVFLTIFQNQYRTYLALVCHVPASVFGRFHSKIRFACSDLQFKKTNLLEITFFLWNFYNCLKVLWNEPNWKWQKQHTETRQDTNILGLENKKYAGKLLIMPMAGVCRSILYLFYILWNSPTAYTLIRYSIFSQRLNSRYPLFICFLF